MSWQDDLEEAVGLLSDKQFRSFTLTGAYYEDTQEMIFNDNCEIEALVEAGENRAVAKEIVIRKHAVGSMLDNLHDKGGSERSDDLAQLVLECIRILKYHGKN